MLQELLYLPRELWQHPGVAGAFLLTPSMIYLVAAMASRQRKWSRGATISTLMIGVGFALITYASLGR